MKTLFICLVTSLLFGCSTGVTTPVKGKIIKTGKEYAPLTCLAQGTNYTVIKTTDGHVGMLCGDYGKVGDIIAGYWTEGNDFDKAANGFTLTH